MQPRESLRMSDKMIAHLIDPNNALGVGYVPG